jgi:hypothetical protein
VGALIDACELNAVLIVREAGERLAEQQFGWDLN